MTEITKLIQESNIEEIIEKYSTSEFKIHELFVDVLKDNLTGDFEKINFEADRYQQEFIEGVDIYKALTKSNLRMETMMFSTILVFLGFKTGEFIHLLSSRAMSKGVYLSEISVYKIDANLRNSMQEFYDSMDDSYLVPKANIAAAKTRISQAVFNEISKSQFGSDMLQMGISYEAIGETQMAINIYQGVFNDFESDSVKLSSGLFPEVTHVDKRGIDDIKIYKRAKELIESITSTTIEEPKKSHVNEDQSAQKLAEEIDKQVEEITETESNGFFSRVKKWFGF